MGINDILQWGAVAIIFVLCIGWYVKRLKRRRYNSAEDCKEADDCSDCQLKQYCKKR